MEKKNKTTSVFENDSNYNSEYNDLCEDCYMTNKFIKAEYTCTECVRNICINCSVKNHKSHADKFHNIYEYVEAHEEEYFKNNQTNLQTLRNDIQVLYDSDCNPLEQALDWHQNESKKRKEILDYMEQKIRSLIEEENRFSTNLLFFLTNEKKNIKKKQNKLIDGVQQKINYIEFHKEKIRKSKSIQQRAMDINSDFLKDDLNNIRSTYLDELQKSKNSSYSNKIGKIISTSTANLNFDEKYNKIEKEFIELFNNYEIANTNFKKFINAEAILNLIPSDNRMNFNKQNFNNTLTSNTPRGDIEMSTESNREAPNLIGNIISNAHNENEFSLFKNEKKEDNKSESAINTNKLATKEVIYYNQNSTTTYDFIKNNQNLNPNMNDDPSGILNNTGHLNSYQNDSNIIYPSFKKESIDSTSKKANSPSKLKSQNNIPNVCYVDNGNKQIIQNKSNINSSFCNYLIGIKSRPNNEVIVYNTQKNDLKTLRIEESSFDFEDKAFSRNQSFPYENSKYVNIGNSVLVTGGNYQKSSSDNCFCICVITDDDGLERVKISKYQNMISKRERHNILYLEDHNQVLVCSGFYLKNCEYTDLFGDKKWHKLPDLEESRGNATIFYLNNRYIYLLGGFKVNESTGEYLNSLEYMDFEKKDKWNFVKIENLTQQSLRISAMGCISINKDKMLLVGGYDGTSYLRSGFEVEFNKGIVKSFERKENLLPRGSIFFSNPMFMKIDEKIYFNFELQAKGIIYDKEKNEFNFLSQSQGHGHSNPNAGNN